MVRYSVSVTARRVREAAADTGLVGGVGRRDEQQEEQREEKARHEARRLIPTASSASASSLPQLSQPPVKSEKAKYHDSYTTMPTTPTLSASAEDEQENGLPPPSHPIDLLRGHPSTHLLATLPILQATQTVLTTPACLPQDSYAATRHPLAYGPDYGNVDIRREIWKWTEELYRTPSITPVGSRAGSVKSGISPMIDSAAREWQDPEVGNPEEEGQIVLTCGASYGLMNILVQCCPVDYTRRVFVVAPTYFLACQIFVDAGFSGQKLTPVCYPPPEGKTLPDLLVEELRKDAAELGGKAPSPSPSQRDQRDGATAPGSCHSGKRIYRYVLYCVPTFGNPTGTTWDFETRRRIVETARKWDILVICDDVYDFLTWRTPTSPPPSPPPPRLVTLDRQLIQSLSPSPLLNTGNVISNCSFSKLLGPGLRCGWQETASPVLARQLARGGANHSGGAPSHFVSSIIHQLLRKPNLATFTTSPPRRPIEEIIEKIATVLGHRVQMITEAIRKHLPPQAEILTFSLPSQTATPPAGVPTGGGYFLWLALGPPHPHPDALNVREVVKLAAQGEHGKMNIVNVAPGDLFECPGAGNQIGAGDRWVRLAVSYCGGVEAVEGIRRLGVAVERWKRGERPTWGEHGR